MKFYNKLSLIILILLLSVTIVTIGTTYILYRFALHEETNRLVSDINIQLIGLTTEASAELPETLSTDSIIKSHVVTRFIKENDHFNAYRNTSEHVLGYKKGNQIHFLMSQTIDGIGIPAPVNADGKLAIPMQRALEGKTGVIIGKDWDSRKVIAAYQFIEGLNLGFVLKVDVSEISMPFKKAGFLSAVITLLVTSFGSYYVIKIGEPLIIKLNSTLEIMEDLYDNSPDLLISVDVKTGKIIDCNNTFLKDLGYQRSEIIEQPKMFIYHPDCKDNAINALNKFKKSGVTENVKLKLIRKDKTTINVLLSETAIRDEQGNIVRSRSVLRNITKLVEVENALWLSEAIFTSYMDSINRYVYIKDKQGNYTFVNKVYESLLGIDRDGLEDKKYTAFDFFKDKVANEFTALDQEVLKNGSYSETEIVLKPNKNKKSKVIMPAGTFLDTRFPLKDINDNIIGVCGFIRDISQIKLVEEKIKNYQKDLEAEVANRTRQLKEQAIDLEKTKLSLISLLEDVNIAEHDLEIANLKLKGANEELKAFSYSVSHNLQAPLRAITGYSGIILEEYGNKLDEEGKRLINALTKNTHKMGSLIDDLLTFSRLNQVEYNKTKFNMKSLIESVYNVQTENIGHRDIKLSIKNAHSVIANRTLIEQVWANMISNAIKFTSQKEKAIITIDSDKKDGEIIYAIKDNGVGFDMKYKDKLFGVFQRLHSEAEFEGTGVGLSIVQRIVHKHGGRVWADGKPGKGSTFYFTLPL